MISSFPVVTSSKIRSFCIKTMSSSCIRIFAIPGFIGASCFLAIGTAGPVCSQEIVIRDSPIEIIVKGKAYPSLKEYLRSKAFPVAPLRLQAGIPAVSARPVSMTTVPAAPVDSGGFRTELDENGWKTVWLNGAAPSDSQDQIQPQGKISSSEEGGKPPSLIKGPEKDDEVTVSRVLGVYPSMTDLVRDFEREASALGPGSGLVEVRADHELGDLLREQASGIEGPLLVLSGHGRVRLMRLEDHQTSGQEKTVILEKKTPMPQPSRIIP